MIIKSPLSLGHKLILEPYNGPRVPKGQERNGFAMIQQKVEIKGLKVLMDCRLDENTTIFKGSLAFIKEESLFGKPWAKNLYESSAVEGKFLIVDLNEVEFITPPEGI